MLFDPGLESYRPEDLSLHCSDIFACEDMRNRIVLPLQIQYANVGGKEVIVS